MADDVIINVRLDGAKEELSKLNALQEGINALADQKSKLTKAEKDLRKEISENGVIRKGQTKAIGENGVATKKQQATLNDLAEQQVQNNRLLKENKQEYVANEKVLVKNAKTTKLAAGSIAQMRLEVSEGQQAWVKMSKAERNNEKIGGALQKRTFALNKELQGLEKNVGINGRSVGDYGQAVQGVLPIMGGFGAQIQAVIGNLGGIKESIAKFSTAQKGLLTSTKATNGGLKAFKIALISTGIGAIVFALGTLIAAFLSTQRGVDALSSVMRPLQEIMNSILGVVQNLATSGLDKLKKAFADPKQAVLDLGKAIKDNLITRILAVPKLIKAAAGAYINSFKLIGLGIKKVLADVPLIGKFIDKEQLEKDLTAAKQAVTSSFVDLKDAAIELSIGVDAEKVKEAGEEAAKFFSEAAARGAELDRLQKAIEQSAITLNREREKGNRIFQEQKEIVQNTLLSDQERLAAAAKAKNVLAEITKLEVDQLNRQINLATKKTEANDTDRAAQQELQDLIADRERTEANAITKRIEIGNQANGIVKTRIALEKKAVEDEAKAQEKLAKDKNKDDIKAIDAKIASLELGRQLELATIDETNAEKFKKEAELLDKINALRLEKTKKGAEEEAEQKTEGISDEIERETEKSKIIAEALAIQEVENMVATAELKKEQQNVIDAELLEAEKVKEDNKTAIKNAAIAAGEQFAKEIFKNQNRRIDEGLARDIDALNLKREAGEVSEEEFNKKRLELDKKAFAERKRLAQVQNVIDFAVATGKVIAQTGVFAPAALIPLGIQAAAQAVIIGSQKFAQGGVIHGASHSQGGVPVNVGGSGMIEAEGGEAIINKRSTAKHMGLLSAINQDGGGVALAARGMVTPNVSTLSRFGNGGVATAAAAQGQSIDIGALQDAIIESQSAIVVQNVASETTSVANRVQQIEDSASY